MGTIRIKTGHEGHSDADGFLMADRTGKEGDSIRWSQCSVFAWVI